VDDGGANGAAFNMSKFADIPNIVALTFLFSTNVLTLVLGAASIGYMTTCLALRNGLHLLYWDNPAANRGAAKKQTGSKKNSKQPASVPKTTEKTAEEA